MNLTNRLLENEDDWMFGFRGTFVNSAFARQSVSKVFSKVVSLVSLAYDVSLERAEALLDSSWGRHLADVVEAQPSEKLVLATIRRTLQQKSTRIRAQRLIQAMEQEDLEG